MQSQNDLAGGTRWRRNRCGGGRDCGRGYDPQTRELPGILQILGGAPGNSDTASALGRLAVNGNDLLIIDKCGSLPTLRHHSQFVDLPDSFVDRASFRPPNRRKPAVGHEVADLKGAIRVDT